MKINSRRVIGGCVLGAALVAALSYPARILSHARRRSNELPEVVDSILVLGTAQYNGTPSKQLAGRLDHAVNLRQSFPEATVYTLGGNLPGDEYTEAQVSADYLRTRNHGVTGEIVEVSEGSSTARSLDGLINDHQPVRTLVVTDPHHALRAELIARGRGIDAVSSPTPFSPAQFPRKSWWVTLFHEIGGMIVQDINSVFGRAAADRVESMLRLAQAAVKPSRRDRIEQLSAEKQEEDED